MKPKIIVLGQIGASMENGRVFSVDGILGAIPASCYKGPPPLILASTDVFITLEDKNDYAKPKRD